MGKLVVTTNMTLDGVVQDPDGKEGSSLGGWFDNPRRRHSALGQISPAQYEARHTAQTAAA